MVLSRSRGIIFRGILEVMPNVYQLTHSAANRILIVEDELTLVDTGLPGSSAQIVKFIHRLGRSVEELNLIIITHSHLDHVGGLAELRKLTQARVAAHQAEFVRPEGQSYPEAIRKLSQKPPFSTLRSVFSLQSRSGDIPLRGGEVLKPLGGLEVIHTPGHTPGSISLLSRRYKFLLAGDALNGHYPTLNLPPRMTSTDMNQAIDSIKKLAELNFDILCLGHGRPITEDVSARMQELVQKIKD